MGQGALDNKGNEVEFQAFSLFPSYKEDIESNKLFWSATTKHEQSNFWLILSLGNDSWKLNISATLLRRAPYQLTKIIGFNFPKSVQIIGIFIPNIVS